METINPGLLDLCSYRKYDTIPAVRASDLALANSSLALWKYKRDTPQDYTDALLLGQALHTLVLQPKEFAKQVAVAPDINRRTNAGKAEWQQFLDDNQGKAILKPDQFDQVMAMAAAVQQFEPARQAFQDGKPELTFIWRDKETGLMCKGRADWYCENKNLIIDLKTTVSAKPTHFRRALFDYGIVQQAAWYRTGLRELGLPVEFCAIVAVEKSPPYLCAAYELQERDLLAGEAANARLLKQIKVAIDTDYYPGYDEYFVPLALPDWAVDNLNGGALSD